MPCSRPPLQLLAALALATACGDAAQTAETTDVHGHRIRRR